MQKHEEWALVVAHRVYMHDNFIRDTASLKEEIETFNNVAIKGLPRWLATRERIESL
jgi:hypothetical protein